MKEGGYVLTCAMCIDPTWPPYVAETRKIAGYNATPPVSTCVPALYTSSYQNLHHTSACWWEDPSVGLFEH